MKVEKAKGILEKENKVKSRCLRHKHMRQAECKSLGAFFVLGSGQWQSKEWPKVRHLFWHNLEGDKGDFLEFFLMLQWHLCLA